jgi:hypothetical protein
MNRYDFNNKISAGCKKMKNTKYLAPFVLLILLALATGIILPSSFTSPSSYSFPSSSLSPFPYPYLPGLGPTNADPSSAGLLYDKPNNTAAVMRQINNVTNLRTYGNTAFGVSMQYPAVWGAVELKSSPLDNRFPGSFVALFTAPLENTNDTFGEKALLSIEDFNSAGKASAENMTLAKYTNGSLSGYRNRSDSVTILESNATTLAGQPAHKIVFAEDLQNKPFKKTQVWTVKDNKAYVITFSVQEPRYDDYLPSIESMIKSLDINMTQKPRPNATSGVTTGLTNLSPHSTGQGPLNLTFSEDSAGIQMQYPINWTKVQPGAPLDDRKFAILVSFIPPPTYDNGTSTGNASVASVNIGIHDLRPLGVSTPSNSVTLEEYNALKSDSISRQGAKILRSNDMTLGGLPGREIYYAHDNNNNGKEEKQTLQMWTFKDDKAYHIIFTGDSDIFGQYLPPAQNMAKSLQIR